VDALTIVPYRRAVAQQPKALAARQRKTGCNGARKLLPFLGSRMVSAQLLGKGIGKPILDTMAVSY
jgi:hypothetical protein